MYRFLIITEKAKGNYSAYCPDLPGCIATGKTRSEAVRNMHAAVELHIAGILETTCQFIKVSQWQSILR
jgi:predicted RNase H-like HicB family nuclease